MFLDPESLAQHDWKIDETLRRGFVKKVYGIVCCQLLLTTAIASLFTLSESWRFWATTSPAISLLSMLGLGMLVMIGCVPALRHRHPWNMVFLSVLTICIAAGVGQACAIVAATQHSAIVLQALITSAVSVIGLVVFAFQTRYNLTAMNGALTIGLFSVMGASLLALCFPAALSFMQFIISVVSAIIFAGYIMVDTQFISRGGAYDSDDYISAALNIYLDIVNLFMAILKILSSSNSKRAADED